uniref:Integral membrane protein 2 n=1 Tax=Rousettus aegyptiacus TaxID=9407 RepID=A0A7J8JH29_ROUAE|nr:integral membrane protein 2C [Rousettus aegyptiacus]
MVKISFQPAVAGIKGDKADKASASAPAPGPAAEILLTPAREERPPHHRYRKGGSVGGVCYLSMGMVVLLMGLVFASVYIYRYFFLAQLARDNFFHCGIFYEDSLSSQGRTRMELEEDVKIYLEDNYQRINVPVPQFGGSDPAEAQVGSHSHATEEQGGGGSFGFVPVGLSTALGRDGLYVGPAEQVGLFAFSKLGAVLEDKVQGWEEDVGEGKPPGTWTPCPLFVLKFRPPLLWGNASFFSFSFSLLHVFTDHPIC